MQNNAETQIDGYKMFHKNAYHPDTEQVVSNGTPRKSYRKNIPKHVVALGMQYVIKEIFINQWNGFFDQPKEKVIKRFTRRVNNYLGEKNVVGSKHMEALHDLGYLPIQVYALPEGSKVPYKVPTFQYWNTKPNDENFFWVTNYLETIISANYWPLSTSATTANQFRLLLEKYAKETGDETFVPFQGHNFSARGCMGTEAAALVDMGHLTSFVGTDTVWGVDFAEEYYNANSDEELVGCSVSATEHSVVSSWGDKSEKEMMLHIITEVQPYGIVSLVSDTYDYWSFLNVTLREEDVQRAILSREGHFVNKTVFRPDSGDNVLIIIGDPDAPEGSPERLGTVELLWDIFGGTVNDKGYKVLHEKVGAILGDGVTLEVAERICEGLKAKGFASTNLVLGIGSFTYQMVTRDTDGWACKATACVKNGELVEIYKDPKTDTSGMKKSAKGLLAVYKDLEGEFYLKDQATWDDVLNCEFVEVFNNGKIIREWTLAEIRERVAKHF
jgi:nicotinamide phosphoribosyltransferase